MVPSVEMDTTPFELFFGTKPSVKHLRTFGCLARVLIPAHRRGKFDRVNEEGIMIGYAKYSKAWKILVDTDEGFVIRESQDVNFDEQKTSQDLCKALRSFPDAEVRSAAGSYTDIIVPSLKRKGVEYQTQEVS